MKESGEVIRKIIGTKERVMKDRSRKLLAMEKKKTAEIEFTFFILLQWESLNIKRATKKHDFDRQLANKLFLY